ncbi:MAG: family 20 glycosylhydrolase [Fimbriimonadaceae bacterium]|nr:family 20 glycosylhydrolase [Fimbriimonadaceae bacterium]
MPLRMWTLDVAREQCVTREHLFRYASESLDAGYDALGLYLEHRFAYPSTPWSHGVGVLTPETVRDVRREFPSLRIIPFINLLGHVEGFLYTEEGKAFREETMRGLQACPSHRGFVEFCGRIVQDTLEAFDDELVHLGGDETNQLGVCATCAQRVSSAPGDGKAQIYATHFAPLIHQVVDTGRRPALWGDMFLEHPDALNVLPREAMIFDWQYFGSVKESAPMLARNGNEVVACSTLHMYNSLWMNVEASDENIRNLAQDVASLELAGHCLTTWESTMLCPYDSILPAIKGAAPIMESPSTSPHLSVGYDDEWVSRMSKGVTELGGDFAHSKHRSKHRSRFLLYANPFLVQRHHAAELLGPTGAKAKHLAEESLAMATEPEFKVAPILLRALVEFVEMAEAARHQYAAGETERAVAALVPMRYLFESLEVQASRTHERIGGSLADIERCRRAKDHVETVIQRVRKYGDLSLGYRPAWEVLTHPNFMPHDQGCWWIVNQWGRD